MKRKVKGILWFIAGSFSCIPSLERGSLTRISVLLLSSAILVAGLLLNGILIGWHGDTLFGLRISASGAANFMFSTSSYLFPDIVIMSVVGIFTNSPFDIVFVTYLAIAGASIFFLASTVGGTYAAISFCLLWMLSPVQTAPFHHAGVVVLCCIYLLVSGTRIRYPVALFFLISEPFFAFFLFLHEMLQMEQKDKGTVIHYIRRLFPFVILVMISIIGCIFLGLKVPQYVRFISVLFMFCLGFIGMQRVFSFFLGDEQDQRKPSTLACIGLVAIAFLATALLARTVEDDLTSRYLGPIGVGLLVLIINHGLDRQSRPLMPIGLTAFVAAFLVGVTLTYQDMRAAYQAYSDRYACLDEALDSMGIDTVVTSYWVNQELATLRGAEDWRRTTQIDLVHGGYLLWNGDLRQYSVQATHAVRDELQCFDENEPDFGYVCHFEETEHFDFTYVGEVCESFSLYRSDTSVPSEPLLTGDEPILTARWIIFRQRFEQNLHRLLSRLE